MNWIEERRLRRFFAKHLVPAAEELRGRGVRFFPTGPTEAETWYEGPPEQPDFIELEPDQCAQALRRLWEGQELPELVRIAGPLGELARVLDKPGQDPGDVSPFIYVMY